MGERSEVHGRQLRVESPPLVTRHSSLAIVGPLRAGDPDSIGTGNRLRGREEGAGQFTLIVSRKLKWTLAALPYAATRRCQPPRVNYAST